MANLEEQERGAWHFLRSRLQNLQKVNTTYQIDAGFVTCAEYQLFLAQMRKQGLYCQPDHWLTLSPLKEQSYEPVTGIHAEDAIKFCEWLTEIGGNDKIKYRVPAYNEVYQISPDRTDIATWCFDGKSYRAAGLDSTTSEFILQQLNGLSEVKPTELTAEFLLVDRDTIIKQHLDIEGKEATFRYQNIHLRDLTSALGPILNLFYGRPGRALVVATNYDAAHASYIGYACKVALLRDFTENIKDNIQKNVRKSGFRMAGFVKITEAVERDDLDTAATLVEELADSNNIFEIRWAELLRDFLSIIKAESILELRRAYRKYLLHLATFAYLGYTELNEKTSKQYSEETIILRTLIWHLLILISREDDKSTAWEGIRIVADNS